MASPDSATSRPNGEQKMAAPSISLPKGGGAIRGIGEKFAANPVTGTGSMTVPIATSPGRSGFGPQLSLSYDSGAGNGPFGFGWSLSLPSITRKTDKGLPLYRDAEESDVFILSGAEDLVPVLEKSDDTWDLQRLPPRTVANKTYQIRRYRPRIEGLFARIERWTNQDDPNDTFWRSISRDNITTWYGKTEESRVADPADSARIFSWLICESHDDKGNVIVYGYMAENDDNVARNQANERHRVRTANRYLKRIRYGNHAPYFPKPAENQPWPTPPGAFASDGSANWFFETVFDYGEHDPNEPRPDEPGNTWPCRNDPFSTYRAGFEVRTYRLCQRVLMFHHFPGEADVGSNCLVRSTDFTYSYEEDPLSVRNPIFSFLLAVTQTGYKRQPGGGYLAKSLPPLEFRYTQPSINDKVQDVDPASLENLPSGADGATYQWVDLDGEGLSGPLTEQGAGWFYKRNESPLTRDLVTDQYAARFSPLELVRKIPSGNPLTVGQWQFLDLAGDGQVDLVELHPPVAGFYERTHDQDWEPFRAFRSIPNLDWNDPNLKFIDLTGDGHADVLITENQVFTWYPSLAEEGFGQAQRVSVPTDEERGPRVVFADGTQTISLADLSGDGLTDIVRIRNGEVCYWPNLGYGLFGAKITMDDAPWFDMPDQFDPRRLRLADIDGTGVTDIIYLGRNQTRFWFNQSGNSWSQANDLPSFPPVDNFASVIAVDLLGNGTACLVWSSPLPGASRAPMRYLNLMAQGKPHLLVNTMNNLGAETRVYYAPSTYFYLQDKYAGKPWITKLPFPVHVVERAETFDHISRNRFVTRYAYHHGYFDGEEREFRGFGMVEQWDTEMLAALTEAGELPVGDNIDAASYVPPVHTKTWFHTGVYLGRNHVSDFFAGLFDMHDRGEYYREPAWRDNDDEARKYFLEDTILPDGLTVEEEREACRALKGSMLRQEAYALDGTDKQPHPYTVTEQNMAIRMLQPRGGNRQGVFFTHSRESISYHYEREPADPRLGHTLTLEVDEFGNVLQSAAIGYGRRQPDMGLPPEDQAKQTKIFITYTENGVTKAVDNADNYRTPLPSESRTSELTGLTLAAGSNRFTFAEVLEAGKTATALDYEQEPTAGLVQKRLIEHVRTYYRRNDLAGPLPLGELESLALPFESYKLAFTPGLVSEIYGGRTSDAMLENEARYVHTEGDANWWIPSGRIFYSPNPADTPPQELAYARQHFFLPHRYRDPFHTSAVSTENFIAYDDYDLILLETRDPVGNRVTVGERDAAGNITAQGNDYRVLQPWQLMDPNRNRTQVAFDVLGMVVGTAVMGKPEENLGDSLDGFTADLTESQMSAHLVNPLGDPHAVLERASMRLVYDPFAYQRTKNQPFPQPAAVYTMARETHDADLEPGQYTKIQHSFSYSDGFSREIQKKIQAEPGPVPRRDTENRIITGVDGQPVLTENDVTPRWVGSGWTVFNNKSKPVRQYEPFYTDTHRFEFDVCIGVSPVLFYDPVERVVTTLHPNHTWEKVVFDPWRQETWDVNDTVLVDDPKTDPDAGAFFRRLPEADYLPTWHELRTDPAQAAAFAARYHDATDRANETKAATKAAAHANTPTTAYFDTLDRPFLIVALNKVVSPGHALDGTEDKLHTRVERDIEGNQRKVIDTKDRIVMRYVYDLLGNRIHQASMEAGERWMLNDVAGNPLYTWDSRNHRFRTAYDPLRRPMDSFLREGVGAEMVVERSIYGETHPNREASNLRAKVVELRDQAGVVTSNEYDFKGNLLHSQRQLAELVDPQGARTPAYKTIVDWNGAVQLGTDTYTSRTRYDALNRPTQLIAPHSDLPGAKVNVIQPSYNEANLLEQVHVWLNQNAEPAGWLDPAIANLHAVTDINYDAKGQRTLIDYGNDVRIAYEYDPLTFRLVHLLTRRQAIDFPGDCPDPFPAGWPGCQVQNLHYTYDPAGNITHIRDDAQQTIYFKNQHVEPSSDYTYDAIYRLIESTGREHLGQVGGAPIPHSYNDAPRVGILSSGPGNGFHPHDGNAMGRYCENYVYDEVGNIMEMIHHRSCQGVPSWTRTYGYKETSQLELSKQSNRLTSTNIGVTAEMYSNLGDGYDAHGNMLHLPHLQVMQWDFKDQLQMTRRQAVNADADGVQHQGERTWYVYDSDGQRVRKVTERQNGTRKNERTYLGGLEVFREYGGDGASVSLERESLHVMDDKQRIALVETRTQGNDDSPGQLIRYQLGNHLGSASLELDDQGQIISYEEYYPYGSTSYQAGRSAAEVSLKRYRYTGKERDEETGFSYHARRYYTPWLARWVSSDPIGISDGVNTYSYSQNRPTALSDPNGTDSRIIGVGTCRNDLQPVFEPKYIGPGTLVDTPVGPVPLHDTYREPDSVSPAGVGPKRLLDPRTAFPPPPPSKEEQFQANTASAHQINLLNVGQVILLEAFGRDSRRYISQTAPLSDVLLAIGGARQQANSQPTLSPPPPSVSTTLKSINAGAPPPPGGPPPTSPRGGGGGGSSGGGGSGGRGAGLGGGGGGGTPTYQGPSLRRLEPGELPPLGVPPLTRRQALMIRDLRSGKDIIVRDLETARSLIANMPDIRPHTGAGNLPWEPAPKGTYRGDLINVKDPAAPYVHPPETGGEAITHQTNVHINIQFPNAKKATIIIQPR